MEASLQTHLSEINITLDPHEQLDCLVVMTTSWTVENGFVTPTMKVKRNKIEESYANLYEPWIGQRKKVIWHQ